MLTVLGMELPYFVLVEERLPRRNNERPVSRSSEHAGDHEACVVFALVAVPDVLERSHDISLSGIAC
jgi:hypothetical protein